jgi:hypothetical protein
VYKLLTRDVGAAAPAGVWGAPKFPFSSAAAGGKTRGGVWQELKQKICWKDVSDTNSFQARLVAAEGKHEY